MARPHVSDHMFLFLRAFQWDLHRGPPSRAQPERAALSPKWAREAQARDQRPDAISCRPGVEVRGSDLFGASGR